MASLLTRVLAKWGALPPRARGLLGDIVLGQGARKKASPPVRRIRIESPAGALIARVEPGPTAREIAKTLGTRAVLSPAGSYAPLDPHAPITGCSALWVTFRDARGIATAAAKGDTATLKWVAAWAGENGSGGRRVLPAKIRDVVLKVGAARGHTDVVRWALERVAAGDLTESLRTAGVAAAAKGRVAVIEELDRRYGCKWRAWSDSGKKGAPANRCVFQAAVEGDRWNVVEHEIGVVEILAERRGLDPETVMRRYRTCFQDAVRIGSVEVLTSAPEKYLPSGLGRYAVESGSWPGVQALLSRGLFVFWDDNELFRTALKNKDVTVALELADRGLVPPPATWDVSRLIAVQLHYRLALVALRAGAPRQGIDDEFWGRTYVNLDLRRTGALPDLTDSEVGELATVWGVPLTGCAGDLINRGIDDVLRAVRLGWPWRNEHTYRRDGGPLVQYLENSHRHPAALGNAAAWLDAGGPFNHRDRRLLRRWAKFRLNTIYDYHVPMAYLRALLAFLKKRFPRG